MASKKTMKSTKTKSTTTVANKKVAPKKASARMTTPKKVTEESVDVYPVETPNASRRIKRSYIVAIFLAIIILAILYILRGVFVAAVVNGQPIFRWDVVAGLEKQGGKQELQSLETNTLIRQEAARRHITVTQADVDKQIKSISDNLAKQGQSLDAALQYQGMTKTDLKDRIVLQTMVEKMVGGVTVSNAEVKDYMDKNKDSLPPGSSAGSVKQQLQQQKLQDKEQTFVQGLQTKAKISTWVNYP